MTTLIYTGSTIRCAGVPYSQIFFSLHSIYYGHSELEFVRQLKWRRTRNYRNDNKVKVISVKKGSILHYQQLRYCHLQQFSQMCHQKCLNCQIQFQIRSRKALFYAATVESGNRLEMCQELEFWGRESACSAPYMLIQYPLRGCPLFSNIFSATWCQTQHHGWEEEKTCFRNLNREISLQKLLIWSPTEMGVRLRFCLNKSSDSAPGGFATRSENPN